MKFLAYFIFLLSLPNLHAQSVILLASDSVFQVNENVDISDGFEDFALDLFFKNNSNDTISVNWKREIGDNCPLAWDIYSVDQILSYIPSIHESQLPIEMLPTDSNFIIRQIFLPRMIEGCCDIKMIFSLDGDPNTPIDTGYYQIEVNAEGCLTTSLIKKKKIQMKIFPNPSSQSLTIDTDQTIKSIEIINAVGTLEMQWYEVDANQIDISNLTTGIYICNIKIANGHTLSKKFMKQ